MKKERKKMSPETQHKIAVVLATLIRISIICLIICIIVCVGRACIISCSATPYYPNSDDWVTIFLPDSVSLWGIPSFDPSRGEIDGIVATFSTVQDDIPFYNVLTNGEWQREEVFYGIILHYTVYGYENGKCYALFWGENVETGTRLFETYDTLDHEAQSVYVCGPYSGIYYPTNDPIAIELLKGITFGNPLNSTIAYQDGYNNGLAFGRTQASNEKYAEGYIQGAFDKDQEFAQDLTDQYNAGYSAGQAYGESLGYNRGVNESEEYNFGSLINAVISAPISMMSQMFDVEILGVNMQNILFGIVIALTAISLSVLLLRLLK